MQSKLCELLDQQQNPDTALRIALRRHAVTCAEQLGESPPDCYLRITWRLYLIQALEACKQSVDEPFWRDVLADVRAVMKIKRGNDS